MKRARTWALMTSYNRRDGTYVSERAELVNGALKSEWGFDGVVMSEWDGARATAEALNAGLDLEMAGPGVHRRDKLVEAVGAWHGAVRARHIGEGTGSALLRASRCSGAISPPSLGASAAGRGDDGRRGRLPCENS